MSENQTHTPNFAARDEKASRVLQYEAFKDLNYKTKTKRFMASLALAVATGTFATGGGVDRAFDHLTDASDTVHSAIQVEELALMGPDDTIDGIKFADFSVETQREWNQEEKDAYAKESTALNTIGDMFHDIDANGYEGVIADVEAYKHAHAEEFVSLEDLTETQTQMESAVDTQGVMDVLGHFTKSYGIEADFSDFKASGAPITVEQTRDIAEAYVSVFSKLPKSFIQLSGVKSVSISSKGGGAMGSTGGGAKNSNIDISPQSSLDNLKRKMDESVSGDDNGLESAVAHELGHAFLDANPGLQSALPEGSVNLNDSSATDSEFARGLISQVGRNVLDIPVMPSVYANNTESEFSAEQLSCLLSNRRDGLSDPTNWRQFNSASNEGLLNMLYRLEVAHPGIAKILVANRAVAPQTAPIIG